MSAYKDWNDVSILITTVTGCAYFMFWLVGLLAIKVTETMGHIR